MVSRQATGFPDASVVAHSIRPGGVTSIEFRCGADDGDRFARHRKENADANGIVFLRGYPHLHWLCEVGAAYNVDPALYQRHLQFSTLDDAGGRNYYATPTLPSFSSNVFQLNITTICTSETASLPGCPEDLDDLRWQCAENLRKYHLSLRSCSANPGDSIVRQYSILSRKFSVMDQTVTIGISRASPSWNGTSLCPFSLPSRIGDCYNDVLM